MHRAQGINHLAKPPVSRARLPLDAPFAHLAEPTLMLPNWLIFALQEIKFPCDSLRGFHRYPLKRRMRFRHHRRDGETDAAHPPGLFRIGEENAAHLFRHVNDGMHVCRCLIRHTDEEIKAQVEDVALQCLFKDIVERSRGMACLTTFCRCSVATSGAMVIVPCSLSARASSSGARTVSARREAQEIRNPRSTKPLAIRSIWG